MTGPLDDLLNPLLGFTPGGYLNSGRPPAERNKRKTKRRAANKQARQARRKNRR